MSGPQRVTSRAVLGHDDVRSSRLGDVIEQLGAVDWFGHGSGSGIDGASLLGVAGAVEAKLGALGFHQLIEQREPADAEPLAGILARALIVERHEPGEPFELGGIINAVTVACRRGFLFAPSGGT